MPKRSLPPGPRSALLEAYRFYVRDPYGYHVRLARAYGDPFTVPTLFGPCVVTGKPSAIKAMMAADPSHYGGYPVDLIGPLAGASSLLIVTGERHRRDRGALMAPFHGDRMRAYGAVITSAVEQVTARWAPGQALDAHDALQDVTLTAIVRVLFGAGDAETEVFREAARALMAAASPALLVLKPLRHELGGLGPWARFQRASRRIDRLILDAVAARRLAPPGDDILSLLLAARYQDGSPMTEEEMRCQIITLLLAGYETTATVLSWAFHFVHRDPEVLARLTAEIDEFGPEPSREAITRLPYLEAVCNETLRLCPPAPEALRPLVKPLSFEGYDLPAGVCLSSSIVLAHRSPEVYPDPERFSPDRFLGKKYAPHEFLPFGGGARRCVGAALAMVEMKLVLATVLGRHRLSLLRREARPAFRNLTVAPAGGVPMRYEGRRAAPRRREEAPPVARAA